MKQQDRARPVSSAMPEDRGGLERNEKMFFWWWSLDIMKNGSRRGPRRAVRGSMCGLASNRGPRVIVVSDMSEAFACERGSRR